MATYEQLLEGARKAHAAGDKSSAKRFLELAAQQSQSGTGEKQRVATIGENGTIWRMSDGSLSFSSPGYSTSDPERVKQLMEGATPVEVAQQTTDQLTIAQNPVAARAQEVVRGTPFVGSYADEFVGLWDKDAADAMRATSSAMQREKPGETTALNITGAIAGSAPMALAAGPAALSKVAQAGTRLGQWGRGALMGMGAGGAEGVAYGAGEGEGAERVDNAMSQGVLGAMFGGVLGAGAPIVAEGVKNAFAHLKRSDVSAIASHFGVSKEAAKVIKQYIDVDDIAGANAALRRAGGEGMLGETSRGASSLLDAAAASGGRAEQVVNDAIEGRVSRANAGFRSAADDALGAPVVGMRTAADEISARTAPKREAAYDAAYNTAIDYASPEGRAIEGTLSRINPRILKSAVDKANERLLWDGKGSAQIMAQIGDDGAVRFVEMPNVRQLDELKRALGEMAEGDKNAFGQLGSEGVFRNNQARAVRDATGNAVPAYREAVAIGGDKIAEQNALAMGGKLLSPSTTREDVIRAMAGASVDERAAAKAGLRQAIDETMANVRAVISDPNVDARQVRKLLNDLSSEAARDKIRVVLGPQDADSFFARVDQLSSGFNLRASVAENSRTARRQAIQGTVSDVADPNTGPVGKLKEGSPLGAVQDVVRLATGNTPEAQALREAGVWEDVAKALTGVKGKSAEAAIKYIRKAQSGQALTDAQATFIGQILAAEGVLAGDRALQLRHPTQ